MKHIYKKNISVCVCLNVSLLGLKHKNNFSHHKAHYCRYIYANEKLIM